MAQDLDFDVFLAKYVDTNIAPGAPRYGRATLGSLSKVTVETGLSGTGFHILVSRQRTSRGSLERVIADVHRPGCSVLRFGKKRPCAASIPRHIRWEPTRRYFPCLL